MRWMDSVLSMRLVGISVHEVHESFDAHDEKCIIASKMLSPNQEHSC